MNEVTIFNNEEFGTIRTTKVNNEPWFCLADVCKALGLSQASKVKERLNPKGVNSIPTLTNGGYQNAIFINESNLYKTIFQSRKPSAERFTDWVTSEVLPSIRKTGTYSVKGSDADTVDAVSKILELRQSMHDKGIPQKQIDEVTRDMEKSYNIVLPDRLIHEEKTTMNDIDAMIDYIYSHDVNNQPSYEEYVASLTVKATPEDKTNAIEDVNSQQTQTCDNNRLTVKRAAELMGCTQQFIRVGLQRGILTFGTAIKMSSVWTYYISPQKFEEVTGIKVERGRD